MLIATNFLVLEIVINLWLSKIVLGTREWYVNVYMFAGSKIKLGMITLYKALIQTNYKRSLTKNL